MKEGFIILFLKINFWVVEGAKKAEKSHCTPIKNQ